MNKVLNFVAAVAIAVSTLSVAAEAHAIDVEVRIDNWLNPSKYSDARSNGSLKVCIQFVAGITDIYNRPLPRVLCATKPTLEVIAADWDYEFNNLVTGYRYSDIEMVELTFGESGDYNDMLIVDQIELRDGGGNIIDSFGVDNEQGYCFSKQTSDFNNSHCQVQNSTSYLRFFPN